VKYFSGVLDYPVIDIDIAVPCLWHGQLITKRSVHIHIDLKDSTWIHTQNDLSQGRMMLLLQKNFNKFWSVKQTEHEQQIL